MSSSEASIRSTSSFKSAIRIAPGRPPCGGGTAGAASRTSICTAGVGFFGGGLLGGRLVADTVTNVGSPPSPESVVGGLLGDKGLAGVVVPVEMAFSAGPSTIVDELEVGDMSASRVGDARFGGGGGGGRLEVDEETRVGTSLEAGVVRGLVEGGGTTPWVGAALDTLLVAMSLSVRCVTLLCGDVSSERDERQLASTRGVGCVWLVGGGDDG